MVGTLSPVSERTPVDQSGSAPGDADRLDAMEDQLRQLTSRLAGWVEAQLAQSVDDRRAELKALRADLLASVDARVADAVPAGVDLGDVDARIEAFEQRVKAAMGRLTDSVESRLGETTAGRTTELDSIRSELGERLESVERNDAVTAESLAALRLASRAATERAEALEQQVKAAVARLEKSVEARLDAMVAQVAAATDGVAALQAEAGAGPARSELLEQRMRSAMGRLAESVEARLAEAIAARPGELAGVRAELERATALLATELRTEIETVAAATRARAAQVQERLDAVETLHREASDRQATMVESKLAEVVERRRTELDTLRQELEGALAQQVREARTEIGTAVADAHRRFVVSVDQLDERMTVVTEQAAAAQAAVARVEALPDAVTSDGRRIEALEEHTRRTDARLAELVDAKLAEMAAERLAEMAVTRDQLRESVDAHLTDVRAEVAFTLGEGRTEVAASTKRIDEALAAVAAMGASVETARRETEERLTGVVQARLEELEKAGTEVAEGRAEVTAAIAVLDRRAAEAEAQVRRQVEGLAVQVAGLVKTASTEAGVLAPLRSDIRMLQGQVAELAETVEQLRPRRKAAAPAKRAPRRVLPPAPAPAAPARRVAAKKVTAAPAKAVAAKKAPVKKAPVKKAPAAKKSAVRRRAQ